MFNPEILNSIFEDLGTLKGAMTNGILVGEIKSINLTGSTAEVKINNGKVIKASKWISPVLGDGSIWSNVKVGHKVLVLCISGNLNNAYILPHIVQGGDKPSNYDNADVATLDFSDDVKIIRDGNKLTIKNGNSEIEMTNTKIEMKNLLNKVVIDATGVKLEASPACNLIATPAGIAMTSPAPVTINGLVVVVI
jgi:phage baseplate assembly protein gpV